MAAECRAISTTVHVVNKRPNQSRAGHENQLLLAAAAARGGGFQTRRNAKCISGVIDLELLLCSPLPSLSNNKSLDERTEQRSQKSREAWESKVGKGS